MNNIIDTILGRCEDHKIIIDLAREIKNSFALDNDMTVKNISYLAHWLYIVDQKELARQVIQSIEGLLFTGDWLIWERVQDVLVLNSLMYSQEQQMAKANQCIEQIYQTKFSCDEGTLRKRQRILQRVLNGSLLHNKEIEEARSAGNSRAEVKHHFLQFKILNYMRAMGGSEHYSVEFLVKEIAREKQHLQDQIANADRQDF